MICYPDTPISKDDTLDQKTIITNILEVSVEMISPMGLLIKNICLALTRHYKELQT